MTDAITADLEKLDPAEAAYFESQRQTFQTTGPPTYHQLIGDIRRAS